MPFSPKVKYRKVAGKKALMRVTAGEDSGSGKAAGVSAACGALAKSAGKRGFEPPMAAGGRPERVRIAGVLYEKSVDGKHLTKCKANKTLNLARERAQKKLK